MIPAIIKGTALPHPTVNAAMAGPKTNPKLKAAPIRPKALGLSLTSVESEITAKATGILPAVRPSRDLAKKRNNALGAKAVMKNDIAVPAIERRRRGRRP